MEQQIEEFEVFVHKRYNFILCKFQLDFLRHMLKGEKVRTFRGAGRSTVVMAWAAYLMECGQFSQAASFLERHLQNPLKSSFDYAVSYTAAVDEIWYSPEFFERERKILSEEDFEREYLCAFSD